MTESREEYSERQTQLSYWKKQAAKPTVEAMMLDTQAARLDAIDRPEVLTALGSVQSKVVLEIGAGIGRFTTELAKEAAKLVACDFLPHLVEENRKTNGHLANVEFLVKDASALRFDPSSLDVVFSNWLLMYLSDQEVEDVVGNALLWLKEGGCFFFRESCYRRAGDVKRDANPTHYRDVVFYMSVLDKIHVKGEDGKHYKFKLTSCANMKSYVQVKKNYGQIYWKVIKVEKEPEQVEQRHFLDQVQYTKRGILRYERLFGHGFVSTGGVITTDSIVERLDLRPGLSVLDVGCGVGGGDFYLAGKYGVHVLGIDLSVNMVAIALERSSTGVYQLPDQGSVSFAVADCTTANFEEATFNVIYSRDTILHIQDKPALFRAMYRWLKPGGRVLITDYCRSDGDASAGFAAYIKQRGYDLHSVHAYGQMLEGAGFAEVVAEDTTESMFVPSLKRELQAAQDLKEDFLKDFSHEDYAAVVGGWEDKVARSSSGEQRWGLFYAKKPFS